MKAQIFIKFETEAQKKFMKYYKIFMNFRKHTHTHRTLKKSSVGTILLFACVYKGIFMKFQKLSIFNALPSSEKPFKV